MRQIIKQPDGKFAVWSSVIDDFVMIDATMDEVVEQHVRWAADAERDRVLGVVSKIAADHPEEIYHQFVLPWSEVAERYTKMKERRARHSHP